jgi:hypothetical protein
VRTRVTDRNCAPSTLGVRGLPRNAGNHTHEETIRKGIHPYGAGRGGPVELQCPNCKSTNLKKVSLAYQEGLLHVSTRTRLRGVVVGSDGPDLVVASGTTNGIQQTAISRMVAPPRKRSYKRLVGWSVLAFLAAGWIVFYANTVVTNSQTVSSVALTVYTVLAVCTFAGVFAGFWRHNHSIYPREFAHWERSYLCGRCGTVSAQSASSST